MDIGVDTDIEFAGEPAQQGVPEGGFHWIEGFRAMPDGSRDEFRALGWPEGSPRRRAHRFSRSAMLELAEVEISPEGLLAFANKYGPLGTLSYHFHHSDTGARGRYPAQRFVDWAMSVQRLQACVRFYDERFMGDLPELFSHSWTRQHPEQALEKGFRPEYVESICKESFHAAAETDLVTLVNDALRMKLSPPDDTCPLCNPATYAPNFTWAQPRLQREIQYSLERTDRGTIRQQIHPDSLITAAWLEFANLLAQREPIKRCKHCGKYFDPAAKHKRPNAATAHRECVERVKKRTLRASQKKAGRDSPKRNPRSAAL